MAASVLNHIGRSPNRLYGMLARMVLAVRLWDAAQRLAAIERRRRGLDADSRRVILHRMELERRSAVLAGQTLIPARGSAPGTGALNGTRRGASVDCRDGQFNYG